MKRTIIFLLCLLLPNIFSAIAQNMNDLLIFQGKKYHHQFVVTKQLLCKSNRDSVMFLSEENQKSNHLFDTVLFNGICTDTSWAIEISYSKENEQWSNWEFAKLKFFKNGRFWARFSIPGKKADRLRYRIINTGIKNDFTLDIYSVEVADNTQDLKETKDVSSAPEAYKFFAMADSITRPNIISREQWDAIPPVGTLIPHVPYRMTWHHTAMQRIQTLEDGMAEMRFIQDFHINGRGWKDIAYHFCVDDSGRIYQGVLEEYVGTHTGGANTGNIGVSMMGNFSLDDPPVEMIEACIHLFSYLAFEYQINPDSLLGHRDFVPTTNCPGEKAYPQLAEIRNRIRQNLSYGKPYVTDPLPRPFSTEVSINTNISFHIKDDVEGVDSSSIRVWLDGTLIKPTLISGDLHDYWIRHRLSTPLKNSSITTIKVAAADFSVPSESLNYSYSFKTKSIDVLAETFSLDSLVNGSLELQGDWISEPLDVILPGLTDGEMLWTVDTLFDHRVRIYPNILESGNYQIYMAFAGALIGWNGHYRLFNSMGISNDEFIEYNSAFYDTWGQLSNSPIYLAAGLPSNGYIELLPIQDLPSVMILDAFRFQKQDVFLPPAIPELKYIRINNMGDLEISWFPALEGDIKGYRLFQSSDGKSWADPIADESILSATVSLHTMNAPEIGETCYFRIVRVDTNMIEPEAGLPEPIVSEPSDTYGLCIKGDSKILIVDNFDRLASWSKGQHFFVRSYGDALAANGIGFESCVNDAVQTGEIKLTDYDIVIYFCGDDSDNDESVAFVDQMKIIEFLASGGKLFVTGSEIGYDLARPGRYEQERYSVIFKANYLGDDSGIRACEGASGTVFEGLTFSFGEITEDTYVEDWPDYIEPYGGSEVALRYQNSNKIAGIHYSGQFLPESREIGQLVYLAFAYETIYPPQSRVRLMGRILKYFGIETPVADEIMSSLPTSYSLFQNYPNPFNPITVIKYELPQASQVNLTIFNLLGQRVITLEDEKKEAGRYEITWDGKNASGELVASGVYFSKFESNEFVAIKKMMLVR